MMLFAALPLVTACEKDETPAIDKPDAQTQLATPIVTVNVDRDAQTIIASWPAVKNADNYHYKISGDETVYETGETRLELQPYSKFEEGSHSIMVQAVSTAQPDLFSPSEWGKADFSVGSTHEDGNYASLFDPVFARVLQERAYIPDAEYISGDDMKHIAAITELDVSGSPDNYGPLTSMRGIEYFESLNILSCHYNQLTELDVSKNTKLEGMACTYNQLTSLDVSANTALLRFYCYDNPGDGESKFPVTAWFDNETVPEGLDVDKLEWTYNGKTITVDYQKAE